MSTPHEQGASAFHDDNRDGRTMSRRRRDAAKRKKRRSFQPFFHGLEKRMMLATFVVMNTNDSGPDSLRQAITDSNTMGGPNTIDFQIGSGAQTISLMSALPPITVPVSIDGTSQSGYAGTPLIDLDGTSAGTANGLDFEAGSDGSLVSGLLITNFSQDGVLIASAGNITIGGAAAGAGNVISGNASDGVQITGSSAIDNVIAGDYIGTDFTGMVAIANGTGVELDTAASSNTIGGLTATPGTGAGNLISGNSGSGIIDSGGSNLIAGNLIGTNSGGTAPLANNGDGIDVYAGGDTIGGTTTAAGNVISGNGNFGIVIGGSSATDNWVEGNLIGTDITGKVAPTDGGDGVDIEGGASGNWVGGTTSGAGNLISGNPYAGVQITGFGTTGNTVAGNLIGTDITGTLAIANATGVSIDSGASGNTIGGLTATPGTGAGNVISGNTIGIGVYGGGDDVIEGNLIGTAAAGNLALPNATGIYIFDTLDNTIGGTAAGAGNLISANTGAGIEIDRGLREVVQGNLIGTNLDGTSALGNSSVGIAVSSIAGGPSSGQNVIGGTTAGAGNVISGNAAGGIYIVAGMLDIVAGNLIGTDVSGAVAVPNHGPGIVTKDGSGITIGGTAAGAGNVVSGNDDDGIDIDSDTGDLVAGNRIGTDSSGMLAIANGAAGVALDTGAHGNTIGGLTAIPGTGAGNVISGNDSAGISDAGGSNLIAGNLIGWSRRRQRGYGRQRRRHRCLCRRRDDRRDGGRGGQRHLEQHRVRHR